MSAGTSRPTCRHCGAPATCYGAYEQPDALAYACDGCCGHGNEDGWCVPLWPGGRAPYDGEPAAIRLAQRVGRALGLHDGVPDAREIEAKADALGREVSEQGQQIVRLREALAERERERERDAIEERVSWRFAETMVELRSLLTDLAETREALALATSERDAAVEALEAITDPDGQPLGPGADA